MALNPRFDPAINPELYDWGRVDGALNNAPLHIMGLDPDYGHASVCRQRPYSGALASGTDWPKMEDRCKECMNTLRK